MKLAIELSPEIETRLQIEASERGLDPMTYARKLIEESLSPRPITGAQALAYWEREGCLGVYVDRIEESGELARKLRQQAETREWSEE